MLTLESLGEMFCSAKNIMDWLASCAKIVATQVVTGERQYVSRMMRIIIIVACVDID